MKTFVFDTETTGLPPRGKLDRDVPLKDKPYVIQLAGILFDETRPVRHMSCFVEPAYFQNDKWEIGKIPKEKFWLDNGLTSSFVYDNAVSIDEAMENLMECAAPADRYAAHNASFDKYMLDTSWARLGHKDRGNRLSWHSNKPIICTMETLTPILKLPKKWGGKDSYKWPNLDESYRGLIDPEGFPGAHDAMIDVTAAAKVLFACEYADYKLVNINQP